MTSVTLSSIVNGSDIPEVLYHGSAFKQDELKPGFLHSNKLTVWDKYESNTYLYASDSLVNAELLGISSALEKKYQLKTTKFDQVTKTVTLVFKETPPSIEDIKNIQAYLYTIRYVPGVWTRNNNPFNNIDGEYKTKETIKDILERVQLDVPAILADYTFKISKT